MKGLSGRIPPEKMWPAGDTRFRVRMLQVAAGEHVRVVECGPADAEPVLLLPGWASSAYVFRELLPALAESGYLGIIAEPRGHGLSDKPRDRSLYTTDAFARHVAAIVDALGCESLVLSAHSLGCAHALRAMPMLGGRVRALILMSPVGTHGQPRRLLTGLLPAWLLRRIGHRLVSRNVVRILLRMAAGRGGVYSPRDIDEYWAPSQDPDYARTSLNLLTELDWGDREPIRPEDIDKPAVVIYGELDPLVARTNAVQKLARSAHVRVIALQGVGHNVTDEQPEATNRAVLDFLATLPAPRRARPTAS
jgi:pimeloyl-ACP methyl ester carboxylesterase